MVRLYIELNPGMHDVLSSEASSQEFVMKRAQEIIAPFTLTWTSVGKSQSYHLENYQNYHTDASQSGSVYIKSARGFQINSPMIWKTCSSPEMYVYL